MQPLRTRQQRGTTLVVAMLFLVILSLLAVTSFNSSTTNSMVTGNMIARQEGIAAAQWLIDSTISSTTFVTDPASVAASTYDLDLDQDQVADFHPRLTPAPTCLRARVIKTVELDVDVESDVACLKSGGTGPLIETGAPDPTAGDSMCANTEWNVRAVVADGVTGSSVAVNQGVGVRALITEANDFCS